MEEEGGGGPKQKIKSEENIQEEEEDRISSLPDCLIIDEILSRLDSTKEAIRTGVLSKRWQHLWTFVHTLIFLESDIHKSIYRRYPLPNILSYVNKTITQCQSKKLKKFKLHIYFHVGLESQFNDFIHYAINCNVQALNLNSLCSWKYADEIELKDDMFFNNSCFTHLKLERCKFSPSGVIIISWNKLKSLCVSSVKLDEDLIQNILSGSPSLETLNLEFCYGYTRLDITSKSVKNFVFSGYSRSFDDINIIEINAPNVLSLTIQKSLFLWKLLLLNVSSLLKAYLNYSYKPHDYLEEKMLEGFLINLHHVKELKFGKHCSKVLSRLEAKGLKLPSNVKYTGYS